MEAEFVSRTKKKQHVEELQKLGAALIALPAAQLDALGLPAELLTAVREAPGRATPAWGHAALFAGLGALGFWSMRGRARA